MNSGNNFRLIIGGIILFALGVFCSSVDWAGFFHSSRNCWPKDETYVHIVLLFELFLGCSFMVWSYQHYKANNIKASMFNLLFGLFNFYYAIVMISNPC